MRQQPLLISRGLAGGLVAPPSGAYIRQWGQFVNTNHVNANSGTWNVQLNGVLAHSTIYLVGMWPNFSSTYPTMTGSDGTNTYVQLDREDDLVGKAQGIQGTQSMGHWYAANVPAGNYTVNMAPTTATTEDWEATIAFEIAGCGLSPLAGHAININSSVSPGTNNISIAATCANPTALAIAVTFDDVDFAAPSAPTAGSGFGSPGSIWTFNTSALLACGTYEYATVSAGTVTALFNANEPLTAGQAPDYLCTLAMFT